ncbi:MAG TPA: DUF2066 domain-containing protein [Stellaceae bacterium]|nr:DUF2066 domain-containing protein [Stellaceae bacterium]
MMLRRGFLLLAAGFLLSFPAAAQTRLPSLYAISNVAVDATAQSAVQARDIARADGERRAFRTLLERLTLREDWGRLPKVSDADLFDLVQDFEVNSERSSTVRYLATLTFRFRPEPVRRLLRDQGIPFTETRSKPLVVLPVLTIAGKNLLWDDPNPWRAAWSKLALAEGLVPMQAPLAELGDVQAIDADQAVKGDKGALAEIGRRYGNDDVLVTEASLSGSGDQRMLQITTARYGAGFSDQTWVGSVKATAADESDDDFYGQAVAAVIADVTEAWKKATLSRTGDAASLVVVVPIAGGLKDWVTVRDRLQSIPAIQRANLISLTPTDARVEIRYIGDPAQLQLVLSQRDLALAQGDPDWTLTAKGGAAQ